MNAKKTTKRTSKAKAEHELSGYLEQVFLAGLGALSEAQQFGSKAFDSLVKQGEDYRKQTADNTEEFIDDVQGTLRKMSDKAQTKASGLLDQVRDASSLDRLESVFDDRVSRALNRLGVPTHHDLEALDKKLDKILKKVEAKKPVAKKPAPKKAAKRKVTKKKSQNR